MTPEDFVDPEDGSKILERGYATDRWVRLVYLVAQDLRNKALTLLSRKEGL